ncbi:sigma-E processing peptidase SpoIIGA [Paenibacillus sp. S3N08]|uniref:Sigma-E processing peptidase SpoIIGA n=2 Tax=Paenibacillus agricola TaxID=2716264 RepID=A0ABX0J3S4_9BACL|nr:sigma-E processing peptidase SpoIIGA [Paenibacillus agricola]
MIVYVDLIFLVNFLIDGLLLYMTARTRKIPVVWWRLLIGSGIGAIYVVFMFIPALSFLFTFIVKLCFALIMIAISFGIVSLQHFLRNMGIFYLINFVAAGGILAIHYFWQSSNEVWNGIAISQSGGITHELRFGLIFISLALVTVIWFYKHVFQSAKQREELTSFFANVQIDIGMVRLSCIGLIDTGNQLYDPLTRTPVMIIEASQYEAYVPKAWMQKIRDSQVDQILAGMGQDHEQDHEMESFIWQDRLRLVPYRGINKATQFMLAIKPDRVTISHQNRCMESHKVWIGLDGGKLSSDNSYQAIIHPKLLQP